MLCPLISPNIQGLPPLVPVIRNVAEQELTPLLTVMNGHITSIALSGNPVGNRVVAVVPSLLDSDASPAAWSLQAEGWCFQLVRGRAS